ncbi:MAG: hypothetical protein BVN34_08290 [Proteobacteria bacterium ST_bin12]|nr:MAG: hypothetical protein BVN34_08290 [Proteobacteria bacterium ST_bin12]
MIVYDCSSATDFSTIIYDFTYRLQSYDDCKFLKDVINENIIINTSLKGSLDVLNSSLIQYQNSVNWFTPYIPIIAVLSGSVAAYCFTRFHWAYSEKMKKQAEKFNKIASLISEIEKIAVEYWTKDHNPEDVKNEVYIKSKFRLLLKYLKVIDKNHALIKTELDEFASVLFDTTTGDDFESPSRVAAKNKATNISFLCSEMNGTLSTVS